MAEELLILNTNPGHSCRTVVLGFDLRMASNYTPQMDCESPSNDPEAKSCTHINMVAKAYNKKRPLTTFYQRYWTMILMRG